MTRLLIVDDEMVFRNNIKMMLDWGEYGFSVCGEASSGREAKKMLEKLQPDIVITDICMADVDGITLISHIYEKYPHIQVVAISGYDQYDYLRASIKYGVVDYLLKHQLTQQSLLNVLMTAKRRADSEEKQHNDYMLRLDHIEKGIGVYKQNLLRNLLSSNELSEQDIKNLFSKYNIVIDTSDLMMVIAEIDGMNSLNQVYTKIEWNSIYENVISLLEKLVSDRGDNVIIALPESRFVVLFSMKGIKSALACNDYIYSCINQIRKMLKNHYNLTACYGISKSTFDVLHLSDVYITTSSMLNEKIYKEYDIIIKEKSIYNHSNQKYHIGIQEEQKINYLLQSLDEKALIEYIENIFEERRETHLDVSRLHMVFAELLNIINAVLREDGLDIVNIYPEFGNLFDSIKNMNLNDMKNCVISLYKKVLYEKSVATNSNGAREISLNAKKYINKNYTNDISLSTVANEFGVNASYLSRIFKEDIGKSVIEYLNCIRIHQAQKMIMQGVKMSSIYKKIGFNSNTYFYKVFKSITNKTPNEYKHEKLTEQ